MASVLQIILGACQEIELGRVGDIEILTGLLETAARWRKIEVWHWVTQVALTLPGAGILSSITIFSCSLSLELISVLSVCFQLRGLSLETQQDLVFSHDFLF